MSYRTDVMSPTLVTPLGQVSCRLFSPVKSSVTNKSTRNKCTNTKSINNQPAGKHLHPGQSQPNLTPTQCYSYDMVYPLAEHGAVCRLPQQSAWPMSCLGPPPGRRGPRPQPGSAPRANLSWHTTENSVRQPLGNIEHTTVRS